MLSEGELRETDEGTPQGSCASPILANIFAHYAIDQWFNEVVRAHVRGGVALYRFADDFVICCEREEDADRIVRALKGRMERFSLKLNLDKARRVSFCRKKMQKGERQGTFDFLGFTFYWGKSRKEYWIPKVKTSKKRKKSKLKAVNEWCRRKPTQGETAGTVENLLHQTQRAYTVLWSIVEPAGSGKLCPPSNETVLQVDEQKKSKEIFQLGQLQQVSRSLSAAQDNSSP